MIRAGHILLVRHYDSFIGKFYWCLPGGGVDPGETAEQAAVRELKEETGLDVRLAGRLHEELLAGVTHGYASTVTFAAEITGGELALGYDPEYAGSASPFLREVDWRPLDAELIRSLEKWFFNPGRWGRLGTAH